MTLLPETENFLNQPVLFQSAGGFEFAYRKFGSGAPLVFLHGWPLTGFTFRKIIPPLARDFTCKMPVLLIWGKEDRIFPARRAREMAAQFPNCKGFEEIPDAGLLVHEEQPKPVAQKILNFLNS